MSGLGVADYLKHTEDSQGGTGKWLRQWRKKLPGEVTVWLHTKALFQPSNSHVLLLEDEIKDKETGKQKQILRFPRFVSPDSEVVHKNQYFREKDGTLQVFPDRDPFLLLREWLRFNNTIPLETPVFKWWDPGKGANVVWERGHLSGLVKRGQNTFNHSLDTKLEYVYVVVDHSEPKLGAVLAREGKLLSQRMSDVIRNQIKMFGTEEGNPCQKPYAITWTAEDTNSPMNMYKAFKNEKASQDCGDEIWNAIASDEFPDNEKFGLPEDGDMAKICEAMEAAAQIELPLKFIFSEDPAERRSLCRPQEADRVPARQSKRAQESAPAGGPATGGPTRPNGGAAAATNGAKDTAPRTRQAAAPATSQASAPATSRPATTAAPATQTPGRRKKADKPAPPPPQLIPCDDCGTPLLPTDAKCPKCGAEYEVDADTAAPAAATQTAASGESPPQLFTDPDVCWSCGKGPIGDQENCPSCGIEQSDNIPF